MVLDKQDANVEVEESNEELSLEDEFTKAEKEVNEETSEESSTQEDTSQEEEKDEETSTLEGLDDDEDFQAAKKELEEEMGGKELTFNQTKKFRKTYWQAKENERKNLKLQEQLDELQSKELSDNELLGETVKRGLLEQDTSPAKSEEFTKEQLDKIYAEATPEQRQWLDLFGKMQKLNNKPLLEQLNQYKERFGELTTAQQNQSIINEEDMLRKDVKEKYNLDYDKDILPKIREIIPDLTKNLPSDITLLEAGWTPTLLVNQVIASHGIKFAEKKVITENKKLNEQKKKANVETDSVRPVAESSNDEDKSLTEIMKEEMEKEGLTKFE